LISPIVNLPVPAVPNITHHPYLQWWQSITLYRLYLFVLEPHGYCEYIYKTHVGDSKLPAKLLCHYYLMKFEVKTRRTSIVAVFNTTFVSHSIQCTEFTQYISHKTRTVMTDECCFLVLFFLHITSFIVSDDVLLLFYDYDDHDITSVFIVHLRYLHVFYK